MNVPRRLSGSMEDYLETIFHLTREQGYARAKEIARRMDVHMPSVTGALRALAARKLVNYEPYEVITLTADGEVVARRLVRSHKALKTFLGRILGLPDEEADENACRMEHAISPKTMSRLIEFIEFVDQASEVRRSWLEQFAKKELGGRKPANRKGRTKAPK